MGRIRRSRGVELPERIDETPSPTRIRQGADPHPTQAALQALPDRQRVGDRADLAESRTSGAEFLDMNIKAFESLLLRARSALREALVERGLVAPEEAA